MIYVPIFFLLFLIISSFPPTQGSIIIDTFDKKTYAVLSNGMFTSEVKEIVTKKMKNGKFSCVPISTIMVMPNIIITWRTVKYNLND